MKISLSLLVPLLFSILLLTGCSVEDPGPPTTPPKPALTVDKTTIPQMAAAGTATISVTSNISWKVTSSVTWVTVSPNSGSKNGNITVTMTANDGTAVRTADITVAPSENGSTLTPQVIKVTQGGSAPYVMVDKTAADIAGAGGTQDVIVTSNTNWTLNIPTSATWITADKTSGVAGQTTVHYTVAANTIANAISADVTYTATGVTTPVKTTFTEAADYKLTSFSPAGAVVGSTVTLTGIFATNAVVKVNGVQANLEVAADGKSIACSVPIGATTGKITVEFGGNTYTSATDLIIYGISGVVPNTLPSNDQRTHILISGNFDVTTTPVVKVNGVDATVSNATATSITITLPVGATDGKITVASGVNTCTSTTDFVVTNRWARVGNNRTGTTYDFTSVAFVLNNEIYTGLGKNAGGILNYDFQIFNPATGNWSQGPTIPPTMFSREFASSFVLNNIAYIGFGSVDNFTFLSDWWSFDPSAAVPWTQLTSYGSTGHGGVAFVLNNIAYSGSPQYTGDISSFDPSANRGLGMWTSLFTQSTLKTQNSSFFVLGNDAYTMGGFNNSGPLKSCYRLTRYFSPNTTTVTQISDLPNTIDNCAAFSINGKGYLIDRNTNQTFMLDPAGIGRWSDTHADLPVSIAGVYNAQVADGIAYAFTAGGTVYKFIP